MNSQLFDALETQLAKLKYHQLKRIIPSYFETAKEIRDDSQNPSQRQQRISVQKIAIDLLMQNLIDMTCEEANDELLGILVGVLEEREMNL